LQFLTPMTLGTAFERDIVPGGDSGIPSVGRVVPELQRLGKTPPFCGFSGKPLPGSIAEIH
jgi:hypothetical protein